jgi:hypothetical protein
MAYLIFRDGKDTQEDVEPAFGTFKKASNKRKADDQLASFIPELTGTVRTSNPSKCGYVYEFKLRDCTITDVYISQDDLDSDSKLRKALNYKLQQRQHCISTTLTAKNFVDFTMHRIASGGVALKSYELVNFVGFHGSQDGSISFVTPTQVICLIDGPVGANAPPAQSFFFCSDYFTKDLKVPVPQFSQIGEQYSLSDPAFHHFVTDHVLAFGPKKGPFLIAKAVEAAGLEHFQERKYHVSTLVMYGPPGGGKSTAQQVQISYGGQLLSSILAGNSTTSAIMNQLSTTCGLMVQLSDVRARDRTGNFLNADLVRLCLLIVLMFDHDCRAVHV